MLAQSSHWWSPRAAAAVVGALWAVAALPTPAWAAQGSIDHVQPGTEQVSVLYSIPDLTSSNPDLETLSVSLNGEPLDASAKLASDSDGAVRRTTVLAMDASLSMRRGDRIEQAKLAAKAFIDTAPPDLHIGIVTFAGEVVIAQKPSLDREESERIIEGLALSRGTRLYDGVREALKAVGTEGQRNILVLSDGRDTSTTPLADVVTDVSTSEVKADVVSLGLSADDNKLLQQIANVGEGRLLNADDPEALSDLFALEAEALARQMLITADLPQGMDATEGTLSISVKASGEVYTDDAFVAVRTASAPAAPPGPTKLEPVRTDGLVVSETMMWTGLAATAIGGLVALLGAFGILGGGRKVSVEDRVAAYSRKSTTRTAVAAKVGAPAPSMSAQAIGVAQRALDSNKGLEASLGARLEAAGFQLKPAEWLLMHAGIAFVAALLGLLLSSGALLVAFLMLLVGLTLPWLYLGFRRKRRLNAFGKGLADTLQLMSGSLSAGLSLAQSVDTVVREGTEPISGEFRRALVEARLGVNIEDGLESVAERMQSDDFRWVVMAIRIQREVGGNLAELLLSVAATMREREYLRRQVKALSAEGRLSALILGGLPPIFLLYLALVRFDYVKPMFTELLGWVMLGMMGVMMAIGSFWLSKSVKVDV